MNSRDTPPPGRSLGKLMSIAAWVLGLIMLTLIFGKTERSWLNPNQQPVATMTAEGVQEVILKANRQGHYLVSGSINDIPVDFLLDTGATVVAVSLELAQRLGLSKGSPGIAATANGNVTVYATRIRRLQIGTILLYDVPASINPGMDNFILLGMSALRQVEFTQRDNLLTLRNYPNP